MSVPLTPLYTSQTLTTLQILTSKVLLSLSLCLLQVLTASGQPQPSATTAPLSCTQTTRWADVESGTWSWRTWSESWRCFSRQTCPTSPLNCHLDLSSHASSKGRALTFKEVQGIVQIQILTLNCHISERPQWTLEGQQRSTRRGTPSAFHPLPPKEDTR